MMRNDVLVVWLALCTLPAVLPTPVFREIANEVGLSFHHFTGATGEYFMPEIIGSGGLSLTTTTTAISMST